MSSNFSRIRAENQFVFLNTGLVYGINSLTASYNLGATSIKYAGIQSRYINQSVNQAQYVDLNINSTLINDDIFMQQTGLVPFNCFVLPSSTAINSGFCFISGYLNHYSAKYVTNQPGQINSVLRFYNNVGNLPVSNLDANSSGQLVQISNNIYPSYNNTIADSNYITLNLNEYQTNRVLDYTFSLDFNRLPIYNIGNRFPKRVDFIFPVNVTCDISFEASDNFTDISLTDFPLNKTIQNIGLGVYSNKTNTLMATYTFQNMTLISNNREINVDGNLVITRKYFGQVCNFVDALFPSGLPPFSGIVWDFGFVASGIDFYIDWGFVNLAPISGNDFGSV